MWMMVVAVTVMVAGHEKIEKEIHGFASEQACHDRAMEVMQGRDQVWREVLPERYRNLSRNDVQVAADCMGAHRSKERAERARQGLR